jgi:hypothetical protein
MSITVDILCSAPFLSSCYVSFVTDILSFRNNNTRGVNEKRVRRHAQLVEKADWFMLHL